LNTMPLHQMQRMLANNFPRQEEFRMSRNNQQDRDWRERQGRNREGEGFPSRDDEDFMYGRETGRSWRDVQNWRGLDDMRRDRGQDRQEDRSPWSREGENYGQGGQENQRWSQYGDYSRGRSQRSEFGLESGFMGSRYGNQNQGREGQSLQGPFMGRGPRNYKRSDERIEEEINERLTQHGMLDATDIEVTVQNGEVTLKGHVENRESKRLAEEVAESISGVKDVTNQIRVQSGQTGQTGGSENQTTAKNQPRKAS
jgi:osmotically-inducible protein OsmY